MKSALVTLAAMLAVATSAAEVDGRWKAVFTGSKEQLPKTVSEITLDIQTKGDKVSGTAHLGLWPGDALLADGKIEGSRISFTVFTSRPWKASGAIEESSGLPKLSFGGTVQGREMRLKLAWDNVMIYGRAPEVREYDLKATKILE